MIARDMSKLPLPSSQAFGDFVFTPRAAYMRMNDSHSVIDLARNFVEQKIPDILAARFAGSSEQAVEGYQIYV